MPKKRAQMPIDAIVKRLWVNHSGSIWSSLKGFFRDFSNWWSAGLCMTAMVFFIYSGDLLL